LTRTDAVHDDQDRATYGAGLRDFKKLSDDALARTGRLLAPGWDKYRLVDIYKEFMADKPTPSNMPASFIGWIKKSAKNKAPN
jgi:hypothetical protein